MPIKTSSAKAKGRKLQQYVRTAILAYFPELEEDDVISRPMGSGGTDLMLSPKAQRALKLSFECKKGRKTPSCAELNQSRENAYEGTLACTVWQPHGKGDQDTMIMFNLGEFLEHWRNHGES